MTTAGTIAALLCLSPGGLGLAGSGEKYDPSWGPEPPVAPFGLKGLPGEKVVEPMIWPLIGSANWSPASYGDLRGNYLHTGIDMKAPMMTPIVAPIDGTIGLKNESFWIWGDDGYAVLGTHLNDENPGTGKRTKDRDVMFAPNLVPGQHVVQGQFIGYVGESGWATGPHLHFELYAPGAGSTLGRLRNPTASLKMSQRLRAPVSVLTRKEDYPDKGQVRLEGCIRKLDEDGGTMTLILTDVQYFGGKSKVVTKPSYRKVKVNQDVLGMVGWWDGLKLVDYKQPVSAYVDEVAGPGEVFNCRRLVVSW